LTAAEVYGVSIAVLFVAIGLSISLAIRGRQLRGLTTQELATLALVICLLHIAVVPWQAALAKVPGLDALVFSIPYTAIFLLGLRLVPKPGAATLLVFGQGLFGQILGRGVNPAWWPYYLMCAACVELLLAVAGYSLQSLWRMMAAGVVRGLVAYAYLYLILAPFLWRQYYAPWYIGLKTSLGILGCLVGAWFAWRISPAVERASRFSS
jgi:ABC-type thiamin/hydroxymethylpyrimidine transport system permease subunit